MQQVVGQALNARLARHRDDHSAVPMPTRMNDESETSQFDLTLFEGDLYRRSTQRLGLRREGFTGKLCYLALPVIIAWPPIIILNLFAGGTSAGSLREFAALDLAGTAQFLIVLPLLMWAEFIIDFNAKIAGDYIWQSGLVIDHQRVAHRLSRIQRMRRCAKPDLACAIVAYAVSLLMVGSELAADSPIQTWRLIVDATGRPQLLAAGWYYGLISLPVLNYFWSRWAAKIIIWSLYLRTLAAADLRLCAGHPDRAGGLGLLGDMQARFGLVIFSIGLMIAATAIHRSVIEGHSLDSFNTWSIVAGFAIAAPLAFVAPLLSFTTTLRRVKTAGLVAYASQAARRLRGFEHGSPTGRPPLNDAPDEDGDLPAMEDLAICYENALGMRSLPLDYRSTIQLLGSAAGPMLPLIPKLLPWTALREIAAAALG